MSDEILTWIGVDDFVNNVFFSFVFDNLNTKQISLNMSCLKDSK